MGNIIKKSFYKYKKDIVGENLSQDHSPSHFIL